MVVTNDVGDPNNIHPSNKRDVGHRLALQALLKTYGQTSVVADGPTFDSVRRQDRAIQIKFRNVGGGLTSRDGRPLNCFTVAGTNAKFVAALAEIVATDLVNIPISDMQPVQIRFAWGASDEPNLMSKDGLPEEQFSASLK